MLLACLCLALLQSAPSPAHPAPAAAAPGATAPAALAPHAVAPRAVAPAAVAPHATSPAAVVPHAVAAAAVALPASGPAAGPASAARGLVVIAPAAFRVALEPLLAARGKELPVEFAALEDLLRAEPAAMPATPAAAADATPQAAGTDASAGGTAGDAAAVTPAAASPAATGAAAGVVATPGAVDPPETIKRALFARWQSGRLGYALLVGDAATFPVRFMVLDRATPAAANYAFYASDLYYADLATADGAFDDWNAVKDGFHARYFGEVRGESIKTDPIDYDRVSYVPEIAVGRWPVRTPDEAAALVRKTLAHAPQSAPRALLVHAEGWIDARPAARAMAANLAAHGFAVESQVFGDESAPGPARTLASLQRGVDLALHLGHGSEQGWHLCLGPAEQAALLQCAPAVFMSVGCSTAHFVNEPPYQAYLDESGASHAGTNAGEVFAAPPPPPHWLQPAAFAAVGFGAELVRSAGGGALVYIGCDTGSQPCALTLLDAFQQHLRTAEAPRVGDAWRLALADYVEREHLMTLQPNDDWYPPSIFFQGMKFVYFGDPTLVL